MDSIAKIAGGDISQVESSPSRHMVRAPLATWRGRRTACAMAAPHQHLFEILIPSTLYPGLGQSRQFVLMLGIELQNDANKLPFIRAIRAIRCYHS
jgi:hypothetical protein